MVRHVRQAEVVGEQGELHRHHRHHRPGEHEAPGVDQIGRTAPGDPDPAPDHEDGGAECGNDPGGPEQGKHQGSG